MATYVNQTSAIIVPHSFQLSEEKPGTTNFEIENNTVIIQHAEAMRLYVGDINSKKGNTMISAFYPCFNTKNY